MEGKDLNRLKVVLAEKGGTARLPKHPMLQPPEVSVRIWIW